MFAQLSLLPTHQYALLSDRVAGPRSDGHIATARSREAAAVRFAHLEALAERRRTRRGR
jgi:hypothetical protein